MVPIRFIIKASNGCVTYNYKLKIERAPLRESSPLSKRWRALPFNDNASARMNKSQ
jgi:hypothetical protein